MNNAVVARHRRDRRGVAVRGGNRTVEMKDTAEEAIVSKEARVVGEVVVRKDVTEREQHIKDTVRRQDVEVEKMAPRERFEASGYRKHYDQGYANSGYSFDQVTPAYEYGHKLRGDGRFAGREWKDVEPNARADWEASNPGTWEKMKMAVKHAWDKATG